MSKQLKAFMVKLASDLDLLSRFIANPDQLLKESGLSREDRETIKSGDQNRLYWALSGEKPPAGAIQAGDAQQVQVTILPNVAPTISAQPAQGQTPITAQVSQVQAPSSVPASGWPQGYYYGYPVWGFGGDPQQSYGYPVYVIMVSPEQAIAAGMAAPNYQVAVPPGSPVEAPAPASTETEPPAPSSTKRDPPIAGGRSSHAATGKKKK